MPIISEKANKRMAETYGPAIPLKKVRSPSSNINAVKIIIRYFLNLNEGFQV